MSCSSSTSWPGRWCRDRAAGPVVTRQGGAGQPDHLRQRDARPDRRGPRGPHRHRHVRGRASRSCSSKGRALMPRAARRGGHRDLRRPARRDRPRRLPDRRRRRAALRARRRHPLHRADRRDGDRRARRAGCSPGRRRPDAARRTCPPRRGCRTSARPVRAPVPGRRPRSPRTPSTAASSASASGSPRGEIRDACRSPIPPADLDGLRRRTRVDERPLPGLLLRRRSSGTAGRSAEAVPASRRRDGVAAVASPSSAAGRPGLTAAAALAAGGRRRGPGPRTRGGRPAASPGTATISATASATCAVRLRPGVRPPARPPAPRRPAPRWRPRPMVTGWAGDRALEVTSPHGRRIVDAPTRSSSRPARGNGPRPARLDPRRPARRRLHHRPAAAPRPPAPPRRRDARSSSAPSWSAGPRC